jgi:hypothetical protein
VNGLSLSKLRAFGASFFIFSDYARPAIRLSALMDLPTIFIFTHDAMGDGEDGPTHQPVEQLVSLRAMPGLVVLRPGDANEVVEAYRYIAQLRHRPAVLALSRQPLPTLDRKKYASAAGVSRGAYVLADAPGGTPEVILIGTGSEVCLARGLDAVLGHFRSSAPGLSRQRLSSQRQSPAGRGAGGDARLGAVRRRDRAGHRHEDVRGVGAAQGIAETLRIRAGQGGGDRQGIAWQWVSGNPAPDWSIRAAAGYADRLPRSLTASVELLRAKRSASPSFAIAARIRT